MAAATTAINSLKALSSMVICPSCSSPLRSRPTWSTGSRKRKAR